MGYPITINQIGRTIDSQIIEDFQLATLQSNLDVSNQPRIIVNGVSNGVVIAEINWNATNKGLTIKFIGNPNNLFKISGSGMLFLGKQANPTLSTYVINPPEKTHKAGDSVEISYGLGHTFNVGNADALKTIAICVYTQEKLTTLMTLDAITTRIQGGQTLISPNYYQVMLKADDITPVV